MPEAATPAWPVKTREMHNSHMNSTAWNDFKFRDGDVVIATYAKSGTTWMQQIVSQLIFGGAEGIDVHQLSPWIELRTLPPETIAGLDTQTHRRFMKTHLPVDALVFSPRAKYIYIGRDGRDTAWSFFNHHFNANDDYFKRYNAGFDGPPFERGTGNVREFYAGWMSGNGFPYWPFWENVRSWWGIRHLPNVMLIHFNDMKTDLAGSIRRIAEFLEIPADPAVFPKIVEHCSFGYMRANAEQVTPRGGATWHGGAKTFINKGTNGRWRDVITADEITAYDAKALAELGPECARWLANGGQATVEAPL